MQDFCHFVENLVRKQIKAEEQIMRNERILCSLELYKNLPKSITKYRHFVILFCSFKIDSDNFLNKL